MRSEAAWRCDGHTRPGPPWQRRIREGDTTTPYWFPSQTTSGSIREDRLVFPIPPGVHWRDAMPRILPGAERDEAKQLPPERRAHGRDAHATKKQRLPASGLGRLQFAAAVAPKGQKHKREPKKKVKNDPRLVAAARELRDKYLEHFNAQRLLPAANGKYDVSRALEAAPMKVQVNPTLPKQLPEAA